MVIHGTRRLDARDRSGRLGGGRPAGILPTIGSPNLFSRSATPEMMVESTTTMSSIGIGTAKFRRCEYVFAATRSIMDITLVTTAATFVLWMLMHTKAIVSMKVPLLTCSPKICFSWLEHMRREALTVKPSSTGSDRKVTMNPRRAIAITTSIIPMMADIAMAAATASSSSSPNPISSMESPTISETSAKGPICMCLDVPRSV
mmetsp:Transcript_36036/g.57854  ORF Transcript_36036/g.57854 Transcript_36036/m.57854 type:complete len:203 (+) Transcript_36036:1349-1957(+)